MRKIHASHDEAGGLVVHGRYAPAGGERKGPGFSARRWTELLLWEERPRASASEPSRSIRWRKVFCEGRGDGPREHRVPRRSPPGRRSPSARGRPGRSRRPPPCRGGRAPAKSPPGADGRFRKSSGSPGASPRPGIPAPGLAISFPRPIVVMTISLVSGDDVFWKYT